MYSLWHSSLEHPQPPPLIVCMSQRRPFFRPEPVIALMSRWLKFRVPPLNFPTDGPPTPRSLFLVLLGLALAVGFSSTMPFSLASRRRFSSLVATLALMPRRCDEGIFCWYSDDLAPRFCIRRSSALCRFLPVGASSDADSSRCDSLSRRCNARSFFKLSASDALSCSSSAGLVGLLVVLVFICAASNSSTGGRAFCNRQSISSLTLTQTSASNIP